MAVAASGCSSAQTGEASVGKGGLAETPIVTAIPGPGEPTATVEAPDAGAPAATEPWAWQLADPPAGYALTQLRDRHGTRSLEYRPGGLEGEFSAIIVSVASEDTADFERRRDFAEPVTIQGVDGFLDELWSDGDHYGTAAAWRMSDGRTVELSWLVIVSRDDMLALAESAVHIAETEWAELDDEFGITRGSGPYPDPRAIEVVSGTAGGVDYRLFALVPSDYPRGSADYRPACYRFEVAGQLANESCAGGSSWIRIGGTGFVHGSADIGGSEVIVQPTDASGTPTGDEPILAPLAYLREPSASFYVAPVPMDWCWVLVSNNRGPTNPGDAPAPPTLQHPVSCPDAGS